METAIVTVRGPASGARPVVAPPREAMPSRFEDVLLRHRRQRIHALILAAVAAVALIGLLSL